MSSTDTTTKVTTTLAPSAAPPPTHKARIAPLYVPFKRRLQTAAVFVWAAAFPIILGFFFISCALPFFWPFLITYGLFVLFDIAPENGGRAFSWVKRHQLWRHFADFFPCKLLKEAELDPAGNYVFGYHPHGIISIGAFANFAAEATGFPELFPGIKPRLLTLTSNFNIPFYRDYLLAMGCASVSRTSCERILAKGPGSSIVIVIGGAAESLNAHPGTNNLTLKKRLGFIKLAIKNGAGLVPVFSFGENDLFEQIQNDKGSTLWKWQKVLQNNMGFTLPLFHGRGIFLYDIGLLPYRRAITTIVGKPIYLPKNENPTEEVLLAAQKLYIDELQRIYDTYKDVYAKDRKKDMQIID